MGKYINVALPEEMITEIAEAIQKPNFGYKSKSEFVKEAVRNSLKELAKYNESKKFEMRRSIASGTPEAKPLSAKKKK